MISMDDVEVVRGGVVLVILGTSLEFLIVHDPEICSLNRVVGVEGVRDSMLAVVVSTSSNLDFISYVVTLTSLRTIGLDRRRLSSCIASWIWGGVPLDVGSVGCIVGSITSSIGRGVCWSISRRVGWSVGCSIGSGIGRLHYFVFASTFFIHRVEGTLAITSLARTLRSTSGVRTCCGSAVSRTSFFDLRSGNADVCLEMSDHWGIFEVVQSGKSGSEVGLW
jgi:hypothetical protein